MLNVSPRRYIWIGCVVFLCVACNKTEQKPLENPTQLDKYFPMVQFVQAQISHLDGMRVAKRIAINGKEEEVSLVLNAEEWRKELDLFIQADINKNSLASSYATEESPELLRHTLIPGEKGEVQMLTVHRSGDKIRRIDFSFGKENLFYLSEGSGSLTMTTDGKHISAYEVNGFQKVWFLPSNVMFTTGEIQELAD